MSAHRLPATIATKTFVANNEVKQGNTMVEGEKLQKMAEGMMEMLDENGDSYGDLNELKKFMQKMHDMDGNMDRLPAGGSRRSRSSSKKRKRKSRKKTSVAGAHEDL